MGYLGVCVYSPGHSGALIPEYLPPGKQPVTRAIAVAEGEAAGLSEILCVEGPHREEDLAAMGSMQLRPGAKGHGMSVLCFTLEAKSAGGV